MLREAGAAGVHVRMASPPVEWPCVYGIAFAMRAGVETIRIMEEEGLLDNAATVGAHLKGAMAGELGGLDYSPICEERQLTGQAMAPPPDASSPAYLAAKKTGALASCLPCQTVTVDASGVPTSLSCPFASSQVTGN